MIYFKMLTQNTVNLNKKLAIDKTGLYAVIEYDSIEDVPNNLEFIQQMTHQEALLLINSDSWKLNIIY